MYNGHELRHAAISLLFPNRCPFCDMVVGMTEYWCDECRSKLPFIEVQPEAPQPLDGMISCCYYDGLARGAVLRMKNGHYIHAPQAFAVFMAEFGGEMLEKADLITAVSGSFRRRLQLGYAHAELIAKDISKRAKKPYRRVIKALAVKKEQKLLNRRERLENARNSYKIVNKKYIENKIILIVDDVSTTGATVSAIASLLKEAGAKQVYALTFAKTK
ncbi:MAG: ComF family protein [Oscillospiraceae bacterium]|nr:ComF family protein [Oscillospiraceae bacterium]